ncbi:MAG TPA: efflux transporter outer membrane subunit [Planctomycetota bacterium]|nr:efflux transporter outer membrane subunit [Planctomycetota bacterium]
MRRTLPILVLTALAASCTVGPDYQEPPAQMPEEWKEPLPPGAEATTDDAALASWWTAFGDPELAALVKAAIEGNRNLAQAEARIREARAFRELAAAEGRPNLSFGAQGQRRRTSGNTDLNPSLNGITTNFFSLGFDASWELDLFGGIRRSVEAAEADIAAAEEDRRDLLVTLLGEVGRDWIVARGTLRRLVIARDALASQSDTASLTRARRDAGMASDLDLARAEALVSGTEATIPALQVDFAVATHALDVLLGSPPGTAEALLTGADVVPPPPPRVPVGLPSDLLRRRPDIRRAERQLAAATARIGVAQAAEYPTFSLTGSVGQSALDTGRLFEPDSRTWTLGAGLDWPILQGGGLSAQVAIADAEAEQLLYAWQSTVLVALQESHDALVAFGREQERRTSLAKAATSQRQAADLARQRHAAGLSDFLDVLDAERNELSAEDELAQSEVLLASDAVALYKALGGGWTEETEGGGSGEQEAGAAP